MPKRKDTVPRLDLSGVTQVKEFKDWYAYSKKLEDAIKLLREKIRSMEAANLSSIQKLF